MEGFAITSQRIIVGDCIAGLRTLPDASVHCCVTSPPYWGLRDYGHDGQIGLEATPEAYVARMVEVFREVRRVLREDGTLWLNLGDSYTSTAQGTQNAPQPKGSKSNPEQWANRRPFTGLKPKDLVGVPWRVAFALQADGWWLRQDIIWHKPNPMPESVTDRCTKAHEYVFLLTKSARYFYDADAVSEAASKQGTDAHLTGGRGVRAGTREGLRGRVIRKRADGSTLGGGRRGRSVLGEAIPERERRRLIDGDDVFVEASATRNRRSVWTITTKPYSGAHFAVMPADLAEPCIKAGCPEECCPVCGKGWERVVERKRPPVECYTNSNKPDAIQPCAGGGGMGQKLNDWYKANPPVHLGWKPACDCAASGTTPGTVLDPFAGSGTTLAVAAELGRNGIGCELNPEYTALAERRIADSRAKSPLFV